MKTQQEIEKKDQNYKESKEEKSESNTGNIPKQQQWCRAGVMGTASRSDANGYSHACFLCEYARLSLEYISRSQIAGSEDVQKFNFN